MKRENHGRYICFICLLMLIDIVSCSSSNNPYTSYVGDHEISTKKGPAQVESITPESDIVAKIVVNADVWQWQIPDYGMTVGREAYVDRDYPLGNLGPYKGLEYIKTTNNATYWSKTNVDENPLASIYLKSGIQGPITFYVAKDTRANSQWLVRKNYIKTGDKRHLLGGPESSRTFTIWKKEFQPGDVINVGGTLADTDYFIFFFDHYIGTKKKPEPPQNPPKMLSFPGAMGFGAYAFGGRYGTLYHVTTLADHGPGSFRAAVSEPNRFVVFDVSGYIKLNSTVHVNSNITIAGQSAPKGGIGFRGGEISFANNHNIICRFIRVRPGTETNSYTDVGLSFYEASNIIIDHVSIEFAPWDNINAATEDWQNEPVKNITVQYSIIANPIGQQFGARTESLDGTWFWYGNLWVNSHNRNPSAQINTVFINNVLYNYQAGYTAHTSGSFKHDIINNYFIFGPATEGNTWFQITKKQSIYYNGNMEDDNKDGILNGNITNVYWYHGPGTILSSPWSSWTTKLRSNSKIKSAEKAFQMVISKAGALPRDQVDALVVNQVKTLGKGPHGHGRGTAGPTGHLYDSQVQTGLPNNGYGIIGSSPFNKYGWWHKWKRWRHSHSDKYKMEIVENGYTRIEKHLNRRAHLMIVHSKHAN